MDNLNYTTSLSLKRVFGINNWPNTFFLLDQNHVFYTAGHNLVRLNIPEQSQMFIPGNQANFRISSVALSDNKSYIAVAEVSSRPSIYLYDAKNLTKRRYLLFDVNDFDGYEYKYMRFRSGDETIFSVLTNETSIALVIWDFQSSTRLVTRVINNSHFNSVEFSTVDSMKLLLVCKNQAFLLKCDGKEFKTVNKTLEPILYEHSSKGFSSAIFHRASELFIFMVGNEEFALLNGDGILEKVVKAPKPFASIIPFNEFVFFLSEDLSVMTCQITEDNVSFTNMTKGTEQLNFSGTWFSPSLQLGLVLTSQRQLYLFNPNALEEAFFTPLIDQCHESSISCLDICRRKNLMITCGERDRRLKLWNLATKKLEADSLLAEDPISVLIHPSGFYLALAYSEKLVFENISPDFSTLKRESFKELAIDNIRKIRFTRGGNKVAVACQNPQIIIFFKFFSFERIPNLTLRGHSAKITCLRFSPDDLYLYSAGADGLIYRWNLFNGQRNEIQNKGPSITSFALRPGLKNDHSIYISSGDEKGIVEISENGSKSEDHNSYSAVDVSRDRERKLMITGFAGSNQRTVSGMLRLFRNVSSLSNGENYSAHTDKGVSEVCLASDDSFVVSAGRDGIICFFEIKGGEELNFVLCRDILVTRRVIEELKVRRDNSNTAQNDSTFQTNKIMQTNLQEKVSQLIEEIALISSNNKSKLAALIEQKSEKQTELSNEYKKRQLALEEEYTELEHIQSKQYSEAARSYEEAKALLKRREAELKQMKEAFIEEQKTKKVNIDDQYNSIIEQKESELEKIKLERQTNYETEMEKLAILGREVVFERNTLDKKYKANLAQVQEETTKTKNNVNFFKKKKEDCVADTLGIEEVTKEKKKSLEPLLIKKEHINNKISKFKEELKVKNALITEKEKKIYELKKKTQELEKFKFVLDYTIKDLNKEVGPKETEIKQLKVRIGEKDQQLKEFNTSSSTHEQISANLAHKETELSNQVKKSEEEIKKVAHKLEKLKNLINCCVQNDNYEENQRMLKEINIDKLELDQIPSEVSQEYKEQLTYLENSVQEFKENINKDFELHKMDNRHHLENNIKLIKQINVFRPAVKKLTISEKPEIIILRKNKKMRNILNEDERMLTNEQKQARIAEIQDEVLKVTLQLDKLKTSHPNHN